MQECEVVRFVEDEEIEISGNESGVLGAEDGKVKADLRCSTSERNLEQDVQVTFDSKLGGEESERSALFS
jgi:hypothetical protein